MRRSWLAARAAGGGIPLRMRVEGRLHDQAADDRNDAVRRHHEHFARAQLALLVHADQKPADDRAQRHAADRRQAVPLERTRAVEARAVAVESVVADLAEVHGRHADAGDELAGISMSAVY